tara:strand:- start:1139 stop:1249 length:111 start_codon:yes stop_codon:yes gene_type:complete
MVKKIGGVCWVKVIDSRSFESVEFMSRDITKKLGEV